MIFKVTDKDIFEDNPSLMAFEEFAKCTSRQLKYVFLTYDYDTPLKKLPIDQRKEQAALRAGYLREKKTGRFDKNARTALSGGSKNIEAARKAFMEIQYDEDQDLYDALREEINQIKEFLRKKDKTLAERKMSLTYTKDIVDLSERKKKLKEILEIRKDEDSSNEEEIITNLSTLDKVNMESQNG